MINISAKRLDYTLCPLRLRGELIFLQWTYSSIDLVYDLVYNDNGGLVWIRK